MNWGQNNPDSGEARGRRAAELYSPDLNSQVLKIMLVS
jgi:hypothetical protein